MAKDQSPTEVGSGWVYSPGNQNPDDSYDQVDQTQPSTDVKDESVNKLEWIAPESFFETKSSSWYLKVIVFTLAAAVAIYILTRDKITTGAIAVCGLLLPLYAARKPKQVNYQLDQYGFRIGDKSYAFASFRCFAIVKRGDHISAVLTPLKRFMPYMYINFSNDLEAKVTDTLNSILPREVAHRDLIDRTLKYIGL